MNEIFLSVFSSDEGELPETAAEATTDRPAGMGKRTLQTLCGASEVSSDQTLWKCLLAEFIGTAILGEFPFTV